MALLPARNILDGTALPVTSQMKTALGSLRDYLAGLLGTDSADTAAARTALGAATRGANSDITSLTNLTGGARVNGPAGLGYSTGSGGTVTQATSKSTAVTLNKPVGEIVTSFDALGSNTTVGFTVNNTLVEVSDVVVLNHMGGGSISDYAFKVQPGAAKFTVYITNTSGGALSQTLYLNFAVIKGAKT